MTFERTTDYDLIREIVTHPKLYSWLTDDFSPPPRDYRPPEHPAIWYLLVKEGETRLGLFMAAPLNGVLFELHTCLLPPAWGGKSREALRSVIQWIFENTPCRRIVTHVPRDNRLALKLAADVGLERIGVNRNSFLKNGKLLDLILFGASPEPVEPRNT